MRIAFDGTTLRPGRTGVGYYTEHLLHHLAQEGPDEDLIVVSNQPVDVTRPLPSRVRVDAPSSRLPRMVWMQTLAPRAMRRVRADIAHFTNGMVPLASPVPTVVTIHDMSLTLYPRYHPARRVMLNRPLVDLAARRADAIITVSQSAKRDIMRAYGLPSDRVHVVHEAAAPSFHRVEDAATLERVRRQHALPERFILYVGTIEPRKNLPKLIEGFARRHHSGDLPHRLVCAGPYGWLSRDIDDLLDRLSIRDAVQFAGYLPFDDLPALYTLAEMFVFPSLYEGFGLPPLEAMASGTPVITSNVSSLPEVVGDAALMIDPYDPAAIADAMRRVLTDASLRSDLRTRGLERARSFSWERSIRRVREIYDEVLRA